MQHLAQVLNKENVPFEEGAVRLSARRAAGSGRDSMSLLDQTLALGGDNRTSAVTREVLGLAGQELFADLFDALHARDCAAGTLAASRYGNVDVTGVVRWGNVYGTQFHPEKSGDTGLRLLRAFAEL